ncbi:hypothetical protein EB796_012952 [Bugula neritina]|uniref:Uncharacterized protein n=1 Tax=Bugula neritina TaxID=10212 RepID=A0A7J7JQV6_BUGNE|nr:hypothetical protein EB796_012952 [Bugula neritina]
MVTGLEPMTETVRVPGDGTLTVLFLEQDRITSGWITHVLHPSITITSFANMYLQRHVRLNLVHTQSSLHSVLQVLCPNCEFHSNNSLAQKCLLVQAT